MICVWIWTVVSAGVMILDLWGIVKSAHEDILRNRLAKLAQRLDGINGNKIVGTNEQVRQLRQGGEGRVHVSGVRFDAERLIHRNTGQDHRGTKRGIALKERLAVLIIANKADFPLPFAASHGPAL